MHSNNKLLFKLLSFLLSLSLNSLKVFGRRTVSPIPIGPIISQTKTIGGGHAENTTDIKKLTTKTTTMAVVVSNVDRRRRRRRRRRSYQRAMMTPDNDIDNNHCRRMRGVATSLLMMGQWMTLLLLILLVPDDLSLVDAFCTSSPSYFYRESADGATPTASRAVTNIPTQFINNHQQHCRYRSRLCPLSSRSTTTYNSLLYQKNPYGRGAEIWPEPPRDDVVVLADSFPNSHIPFVAIASIGEADIMDSIHQQEQKGGDRNTVVEFDQLDVDQEDMSGQSKQQLQPRRRRSRKRDSLRRILRRAAAKEELDAESSDYNNDDPVLLGEPSLWPFPLVVRLFGMVLRGIRKLERTPALVVSSLLLLQGWIRPLDVAVVSTITTYIMILTMASQSYREDSYVPFLPATPPQGHVPTMVINPLGRDFATETGYYHNWLRLGAVIGCVIPTLWTITIMLAGMIPTSMTVGSSRMASLFHNVASLADTSLSSSFSSPLRACARHLFLLCCQIMTEATTKRRITTTPLPIRILVPCLYNACRLSYLWLWVQCTFQCQYSAGSAIMSSSTASLALAVLNMAYWSLNLFGFLIPIAAVRYMRTHFFCVEAEEVKTRRGLEETTGLIPNYNTGGDP
jgi:hypothetical protein